MCLNIRVTDEAFAVTSRRALHSFWVAACWPVNENPPQSARVGVAWPAQLSPEEWQADTGWRRATAQAHSVREVEALWTMEVQGVHRSHAARRPFCLLRRGLSTS